MKSRTWFLLSILLFIAAAFFWRLGDLTPFRITGRVQQSIWASLGDFDLLTALEHLDVPALVIHGRQDPIPLASSKGAARALGAPCVVLEDCGHVPYVEQPVQLFTMLQDFLREASSPAIPRSA